MRPVLALFLGIVTITMVSAQARPASDAAGPFYTMLLSGASERLMWEIIDRAMSETRTGRPESGIGVLTAVVDGAGRMSDGEREAVEFELAAAVRTSTGHSQALPGPIMRLYMHIDRIHDPALRAEVIRWIPGSGDVDPKPLILEGKRLADDLARVPAVRNSEGFERFGYDRGIEEEAAAFVEACRGRVTQPLAVTLGAIARLSRTASTAAAARVLARAYFNSQK